jgi:hypothetical protein
MVNIADFMITECRWYDDLTNKSREKVWNQQAHRIRLTLVEPAMLAILLADNLHFVTDLP